MTQQYPDQDPQQRYGQPQQYGQQPYGQPVAPWGPGGQLSPMDRTWGGAAHWSALVAAFLALAFLGPLLVMLVRSDSPWVRRQAVESLNFQLSMLIYGVVGTIAALVLVVLTLGIGLLAVVPVALAAAVFWLVFTVIGAVKASGGEDYRYPLTLRMVS